ncbi:flagellar basal body-associated FliL family protein [Lapillicoccus jejuensis]|uniref:Flagellar protein FliL n=1 Tax=Lapillicoccus jejuensis TaxID=402171 RepID=A0A542E4G4_9MICO|nr:flagellar basal body-associated FliL family protein [Lapillicoccus jejuensis]TQJ10154.1 flagellar FliL protein [Lapillicoccus jejuensis]
MSVSTIDKKGAKGAKADEEAAAGGGKKKLIIIIAVAVLLVAGGGYFFLGRSSGAPAAAPKDEPGAVVALDAIQINLSGEHYLRISVALQMTKTAEAEVDGSKAQDAVISTFSGKPIAQVDDPTSRAKLKAQLLEKIRELYEKKVMALYFTQFVTQ